MTESAAELVARYNQIMELCRAFHENNGEQGANGVIAQVNAITSGFNSLVKADEEAGQILEAGRYAGLGAAIGRVARCLE